MKTQLRLAEIKNPPIIEFFKLRKQLILQDGDCNQ